MRIAQIAPPWIPIPPKQYGGTENVIYHLVEEQVAQGHDVTLIAPGDSKTSAKLVSFYPKSLLESGVPWTMHLKAFYHLQKAVDYIKEQRFDIVHTHLSSSSDMYLFPLTAHLGTPHVSTLHSIFPFDRDARSNRTGDADSLYMEWAPFLPMVAISESARQNVPYPLNFVGIVHHGLYIQDFKPVRRRMGENFVWLGRFMPEKGAHLAIEAAKQAHVPLVLAGVIDRHSRISMDYFEQLIKPQIGKDQITYIGPVNMRQKNNLFGRSRGFLNPIEWEEPFGMVMIESMAMGCPVISFARGAASEIIVNDETGFLVDTVDEMASAIAKIDKIDRVAIRKYVEQNFSSQAMAKNYIEIYKKIIKKHKVNASDTSTNIRLMHVPTSQSIVKAPTKIPVPPTTRG
ncbi:MAG TPA: glycosyltransferase family 4 protein [Ktedonobacteraceae bacterium]|nr:glycosyltransferase family 4 protein [Ktedonobacteraceae bacterium]